MRDHLNARAAACWKTKSHLNLLPESTVSLMRNALRFLLVLLLVAPIVGCKGCQQVASKDDKTKKEEEEQLKKKQRLVAYDMRTLPFSTESVGNLVKPGHWYQARQKVKANFNDETLSSTIELVDKEKALIPFAANSQPVDFERNVTLPKGQEKFVDLKFFHPPVESKVDPSSFESKPTTIARVRYALRGLGTPLLEQEFPNKLLDGYQYNFVVLCRDVSRYTFWRGLDCVVWPRIDDMQESRLTPHRVMEIKEDETATQFPNRLYFMTSISHIVVNDFSIATLSPDQQSALQDWLHFGGTIILNGPDALSGIEGSFLRDIAPVQNTADSELTDSEIEGLNNDWTIRIAGGDRIPFKKTRTIPKLQGKLARGANWLPTLDGLIAERLVGQGRVVMTTFPMTDAAFVQWPSYSSMIHNAVLRKPYREPSVGAEAATRYAGAFEGSEMNPVHSTRLRLWARDLDLSTMRTDNDVKAKGPKDLAAQFPTGKSSSLGAWNPNSKIVEDAALCLRESSGITVPQIETIIKLLAGYLIILVPVNWLVFRTIRRVELAWVAAPIIAIAGAVIVAKSVQLDVGFIRSETTFGFLECHNGYDRGVLSSYRALYTSLSTNYQAVFPDDSGVVMPMASSSSRKARELASTIHYSYADDRGAGLPVVSVLSNTTGLIQSEEVVKLSGSLRADVDLDLQKATILNDSNVPIHDLGIIGITESGKLVSGWLGTAEPGQAKSSELQIRDEDDRWRSEWNRESFSAKPTKLRDDGVYWAEDEVKDIYLGSVMNNLSEHYPLQRGESIAIGWTDSEVSQLKVSPVTNQKRLKTLVLLHLTSGKLAEEVRPDTRIFARSKEDLESP